MSNIKFPGLKENNHRKIHEKHLSKGSVAKDYLKQRSMELSTPIMKRQNFKLNDDYLKKYWQAISVQEDQNNNVRKSQSMLDLNISLKEGYSMSKSSDNMLNSSSKSSSFITQLAAVNSDQNSNDIKKYCEEEGKMPNFSNKNVNEYNRKSSGINSTFELLKTFEPSFVKPNNSLMGEKRIDTSIVMDLDTDDEECNDILRCAPDINQSVYSDNTPFLGFGKEYVLHKESVVGCDDDSNGIVKFSNRDSNLLSTKEKCLSFPENTIFKRKCQSSKCYEYDSSRSSSDLAPCRPDLNTADVLKNIPIPDFDSDDSVIESSQPLIDIKSLGRSSIISNKNDLTNILSNRDSVETFTSISSHSKRRDFFVTNKNEKLVQSFPDYQAPMSNESSKLSEPQINNKCKFLNQTSLISDIRNKSDEKLTAIYVSSQTPEKSASTSDLKSHSSALKTLKHQSLTNGCKTLKSQLSNSSKFQNSILKKPMGRLENPELNLESNAMKLQSSESSSSNEEKIENRNYIKKNGKRHKNFSCIQQSWDHSQNKSNKSKINDFINNKGTCSKINGINETKASISSDKTPDSSKILQIQSNDYLKTISPRNDISIIKPIVKNMTKESETNRQNNLGSNISNNDCIFRPVSRGPVNLSRASRTTDTSSIVELEQIYNESSFIHPIDSYKTSKPRTPYNKTFIETCASVSDSPVKYLSNNMKGSQINLVDSSGDSSPENCLINRKSESCELKFNGSKHTVGPSSDSSLSSLFLSPLPDVSQNMNFSRIASTDAHNITLDKKNKNLSPVNMTLPKPTKTYSRKTNKYTTVKLGHEWFQSTTTKKRNNTNLNQPKKKKKLFNLESNYKDSSGGSADSFNKNSLINSKDVNNNVKPVKNTDPTIYSLDDWSENQDEPIPQYEMKKKNHSVKNNKRTAKSVVEFDFDLKKLNNDSDEEFIALKRCKTKSVNTNLRRSSRNKRKINYKEVSESEGDKSRAVTPSKNKFSPDLNLSERTKIIKDIILKNGASSNDVPDKNNNISSNQNQVFKSNEEDKQEKKVKTILTRKKQCLSTLNCKDINVRSSNAGTDELNVKTYNNVNSFENKDELVDIIYEKNTSVANKLSDQTQLISKSANAKNAGINISNNLLKSTRSAKNRNVSSLQSKNEEKISFNSEITSERNNYSPALVFKTFKTKALIHSGVKRIHKDNMNAVIESIPLVDENDVSDHLNLENQIDVIEEKSKNNGSSKNIENLSSVQSNNVILQNTSKKRKLKDLENLLRSNMNSLNNVVDEIIQCVSSHLKE